MQDIKHVRRFREQIFYETSGDETHLIRIISFRKSGKSLKKIYSIFLTTKKVN